MPESEQPSSGILASIRRMADTVLSTIHNRVELFALELEEEKCWLVSTLVWTAVTIFLCVLAITSVTVTTVLLASEEARPYVLGGFSLIYVIAATWAVFVLRRKFKHKPPPLSDTVSELKKDINWIRSQD